MPHASVADSTRAVDVVFTFSWETWDDAVHREMMRPPDRLVSYLLESPDVGGLLVANPARSVVSSAIRTLRGRAPFPEAPRRALVTPARMRRVDPPDRTRLVASYLRYDSALQRAAARSSLVDPHVITCHPLVAGFAPFGWARDLTYFGRDDWLGFEARASYHPAIAEAYRRIARSGTKVIAVSQEIIDRIDPRGPALVVPNGVEPAEWVGEPMPPPSWFTEIPGPRVTYVGTLDDRLDVAGIVQLAAQTPDIHYVLVGPVGNQEAIAPLTGIRNVHTHSHVGRRELAAVLRASDACGLLHIRSPLTSAMSPLKIFEYLAAGAPVIATDLPPVRNISSRVVLRESVADFAEAMPQLISMGQQDEAARLEFIDSHSWARGHEQILDFIRS